MREKGLVIGLLVMGLFPVMASYAGETGTSTVQASGADTDGDGKLSFEEFKAARLKLIAEQFNHMDTNKDGYLDADERLRAVTQLKSQLQNALAPPASPVPEPVTP